MSVERDSDPAKESRYERGKVTLSRDMRGKSFWRVTVYVGDTQEELDLAVDEAKRIDARFIEELS